MRRSAGGCYEIRGTHVRRVTTGPVEADTVARWSERREDLLRESATIADPDHRLTAEEAGLWRAMWKELETVDAAVTRLEQDSGLPPGNLDRTAVCRWENEGGAPHTVPPKEGRLASKGAVEATAVTTSDVTEASEARWQAWLAKGRVQDLRTQRIARLAGVGFAAAGVVALATALLVR